LQNGWKELKINPYAFFRILLGVFFVFTGAEKIISPYQNFLHVVQGYDILPVPFEIAVAHLFPWIEFLMGIFLFLGLWTRWSLRAGSLMMLIFILVVSQALIRRLPITECGCFGEFLSLPLHGVLIMDTALLFLMGLLYHKGGESKDPSLDKYFSRNA